MVAQPIKKAERIEAYVKSFGPAAEGYDPCYLAYFVCFNTQEYYEAHDVLEHLWLQREDENHAFFKGLIQLAGAFVHLKKQNLRPEHPTMESGCGRRFAWQRLKRAAVRWRTPSRWRARSSASTPTR